jgi:glycosyltransferase involved in cell wall biosynthesis
MRLLVAPHDLAIGGSQINAIDLAVGAANAGHDVVVYGIPGPLVGYIEDRGLEFIPARPLRYRPAPSRIAQLRAIAERRRIDLIHAYEWPPCLEAYYGAHLVGGVPLVCTIMSMSVSPLVPRTVPLVMGTEALGEEARRAHLAPVWVLEPQIDTDADHPGLDGAAFRRSQGISDDAPLVVTVSRLALDLKLDALIRVIDAIDLIADRLPARLVIVGGGPAAAALQQRAATVNRRRGREAITFTGPVSQPGTAYAAADVVVGMGSSALRAMSIGRALVVQGEAGFSEILAPESLPYFLHEGFWGHGDAPPTSVRLAEQLESLLSDPERRCELGAFGRRTVESRFSLPRAAERQIEIYESVLTAERQARQVDALTAAMRALALELRAHDPRRKRSRLRTEQALLASAGRLQPEAANA